MGQPWNKPAYLYAVETTLRSLWSQFRSANKGATAASLSKVFGVNAATVEKWFADEDDASGTAQTTRYAVQIEEVTGISIDRYLVCAAKRELIAELPGLAETIRSDPRETRSAFLEAMRPYGERVGYQAIDLQLKFLGRGSQPWFQGRHKPSGESLKALMRAVYGVGFQPEWNTDDIMLARVTRGTFGREPVDTFPWTVSYREVCRRFFHHYGALAQMTEVERRSGLNRQVAIRVLNTARSDDNKPSGVYVNTVYAVLIGVLRMDDPTLAKAMEANRKEFEKEGELKKKLELPKSSAVSIEIPTVAAAPIAAPPVQAQPTPVPVATPDPEPNSDAELARHYLAIAHIHARRAGISLEQPAATRSLDEEAASALALAEVELFTLEGIAAQPGKRISQATLGRMRAVLQRLRPVFLRLLPMDADAKLDAYHLLGHDMDELVLALRSSKFPTLAAAIKRVEEQRQFGETSRRK